MTFSVFKSVTGVFVGLQIKYYLERFPHNPIIIFIIHAPCHYGPSSKNVEHEESASRKM